MKKGMNTMDLMKRYQANCDRLNEIADLCENEQRERTDAEEAELKALVRDNQIIDVRLKTSAANYLRENPNAKAEVERIIRENHKNGKKTEMIFTREVMMVNDLSNSAVIPLNVGDIIKPLQEGFILDKVGLPMPTGLAGNYVWPTYEMIEATVLGEGAALSDTKVPFSKLSANPARMGVKVPVTNQAIQQTEGLLETIIRQIMPAAIKQLLNKVLFGFAAVNQVAETAGLVGPYVAAKANPVALSEVPTFEQLNADMKAAVLETGIDGEHMCFTMTKSMLARLEGTPINENGVYVPIAQNGKVCGLPVYTTNEMRSVTVKGKKYTSGSWVDYSIQDSDTVAYKVKGYTEAAALAKINGTPSSGSIAEVTVIEEFIGLGDWRYQPMGLFGSIRFTVDPYTKAGEDATVFVLNCDYGTKTLRPEAFIVGRVGIAE